MELFLLFLETGSHYSSLVVLKLNGVDQAGFRLNKVLPASASFLWAPSCLAGVIFQCVLLNLTISFSVLLNVFDIRQ